LKAGHATWLREHPELQTLVADFLQFVLFRKPDNVVDVSANYFASFT